MHKIIFLIFFLLCISCDYIPSFSQDQIIEGKFEIAKGKIGDSIKEAKNYIYSPVKKIILYKKLFPDGTGILWIKKEFNLPDRLHGQNLSLFSEPIIPNDEIYLNDYLIGKEGLTPYKEGNFFPAWNNIRNYKIKNTLLKKEKNILHIKVFINYEILFPGKLLVGTENKINSLARLHNFFRIKINLFTAIILFSSSILFLIIFVKRPKNRETLYYSLLALSGTIYLSNFYIYSLNLIDLSIVSYFPFQKIIFSMMCISPFFYCKCIMHFQEIVIKRIKNFLLISITIFPAVIIIFISYQILLKYRLVFLSLNLIAFIPFTLHILFLKRNKLTNILLAGYIPFLLSTTIDSIGVFLELNYFILSSIGLFLLVLSLAIIMVNSFIDAHNKFQELNIHLEEKVQQRTEELDKVNEELQTINEILISQNNDLITVKEVLEIVNNELGKTRDALWGEMQLAKKIQTILLPENPQIPGFEITAYMNPADSVGGDYYDIINCENNDWVIIGDVSGHGVPAGLIMMMVQSATQAYLNKYPNAKPTELLSVLDVMIKHNTQRMKEDKYMTITALSFNKDGSAIFAGLHQHLLIYRAGINNVEVLKPEGIWLSPWDMPNMGFKNINYELKLNSGDILLLYTDGITEAINKNKEFFMYTKLIKILEKYNDYSTEHIKGTILETLELCGYTTNDDVTILVLKRI